MNALEIRATVGLALIYALRMIGQEFSGHGAARFRTRGAASP